MGSEICIRDRAKTVHDVSGLPAAEFYGNWKTVTRCSVFNSLARDTNSDWMTARQIMMSTHSATTHDVIRVICNYVLYQDEAKPCLVRFEETMTKLCS